MKIHLLVLVLFAQLLLTGCSGDSVAITVEAKPERVIPVSLVTAGLRDNEHLLQAIGTLESYQNPTLSAEAAGSVISILVDEGDKVAKGQLLAEIDPILYEIKTDSAAAELRRLSVLVKNQHKEVERLTALAKKQSVSKDRLEDEQAQLRVVTAQRDIAAKSLQEAQHWKNKTKITAPISGRVARRFISTGDYVKVGNKLFDLVAIDKLRARLNFPEHESPSIEIGKQVRLSSPSNLNQTALGLVKNIRPVVNPASRGIEVLVEVDNPGGWLPGSTVDAGIVVKISRDAVTVPVASVIRRPKGSVVYIVRGDRVEARLVQLGRQTDDWVEILQGLEAGQNIVLDGAHYVDDGSAIVVSDN